MGRSAPSVNKTRQTLFFFGLARIVSFKSLNYHKYYEQGSDSFTIKMLYEDELCSDSKSRPLTPKILELASRISWSLPGDSLASTSTNKQTTIATKTLSYSEMDRRFVVSKLDLKLVKRLKRKCTSLVCKTFPMSID